MLFDVTNRKWTEPEDLPEGCPAWSHDGKYLYFQSFDVKEPAFFRMRVSDRKRERLTGVNLRRVQADWFWWNGLAPDDSPLVLRDESSEEIYALDWLLPLDKVAPPLLEPRSNLDAECQSLQPFFTASAKSRMNGSSGKREFADRWDGNLVSHDARRVKARPLGGLQLVFLRDMAGFCPMTSESDRQNLWIDAETGAKYASCQSAAPLRGWAQVEFRCIQAGQRAANKVSGWGQVRPRQLASHGL